MPKTEEQLKYLDETPVVQKETPKPVALSEDDRLRIALLTTQKENLDLKKALCRQELDKLEQLGLAHQKQYSDLRATLAVKYQIDWAKTRLDEGGRFVPIQ